MPLRHLPIEEIEVVAKRVAQQLDGLLDVDAIMTLGLVMSGVLAQIDDYERRQRLIAKVHATIDQVELLRDPSDLH